MNEHRADQRWSIAASPLCVASLGGGDRSDGERRYGSGLEGCGAAHLRGPPDGVRGRPMQASIQKAAHVSGLEWEEREMVVRAVGGGGMEGGGRGKRVGGAWSRHIH